MPIQVEFNHLYVTLKRETVRAISESEYVAERFSLHRSTVEADEESWTGIFILGRRAYLEIFAPGGAEGLIEGYSGTAFSTKRLGQIDEMENRLMKAAPGRAQRKLRVRKTDGGEVPWFHYLNLEPVEKAGFAAWVIDVHEKYYPWRGIEVPANGRFSREAYLKASGTEETTIADDIVEIHLELSADEQSNLGLFLRTLGFDTTEASDGFKYGSDNFNLITSVASDPSYRIRKVVYTVTKSETEPHELRFGPDAGLTAEAGRLIWRFGSAA